MSSKWILWFYIYHSVSPSGEENMMIRAWVDYLLEYICALIHTGAGLEPKQEANKTF